MKWTEAALNESDFYKLSRTDRVELETWAFQHGLTEICIFNIEEFLNPGMTITGAKQ